MPGGLMRRLENLLSLPRVEKPQGFGAQSPDSPGLGGVATGGGKG